MVQRIYPKEFSLQVVIILQFAVIIIMKKKNNSFSVEFVSGDVSLQSEEISEYLDGMVGNTERIKDQITVH